MCVHRPAVCLEPLRDGLTRVRESFAMAGVNYKLLTWTSCRVRVVALQDETTVGAAVGLYTAAREIAEKLASISQER